MNQSINWSIDRSIDRWRDHEMSQSTNQWQQLWLKCEVFGGKLYESRVVYLHRLRRRRGPRHRSWCRRCCLTLRESVWRRARRSPSRWAFCLWDNWCNVDKNCHTAREPRKGEGVGHTAGVSGVRARKEKGRPRKSDLTLITARTRYNPRPRWRPGQFIKRHRGVLSRKRGKKRAEKRLQGLIAVGENQSISIVFGVADTPDTQRAPPRRSP